MYAGKMLVKVAATTLKNVSMSVGTGVVVVVVGSGGWLEVVVGGFDEVLVVVGTHGQSKGFVGCWGRLVVIGHGGSHRPQ